MTASQRTPIVDGLNRFVNDKIEDWSQLLGKSLPASAMAVDPSGTIVTVNFEIETGLTIPIVQCPIGFPEWVRWPIQKGDPGFVTAVDLYMGGMSGLGDGVAELTQQPNLSTLVWFPCGNFKLPATDDPQKVVIYGPTGVILRDKNKACVFTLTPDGITITLNGQPYMSFDVNGITWTYGGNTISMNASGIVIDGLAGTVNVNGGAGGINLNGGAAGTAIDGKIFLSHTHTGVTSGPGDTGPVT